MGPLRLQSGVPEVITDQAVGHVMGRGTAKPADGALGWAPGALFLDTDATGGTGLFINRGTRASANFDAFIDLAALTATLAEINSALTGITATATELNRAADASTRIVPLAVSTAITEVAHDGKTITMSGAGMARTFTLPAATGSGCRFRFVVAEVNTSNYLIKSVVGTDLFEGAIIGCDGGGVTAPVLWAAGTTDDTITLNGTTTGGVSIGDWIEVEDISAVGWAVRGMVTQSGMEATMFSDTVT